MNTIATCIEFRSASEYTATVWIPKRLAERITRHAISPRFAIKIFERGVTVCSACFGAFGVRKALQVLNWRVMLEISKVKVSQSCEHIVQWLVGNP